MLYTSPYKTDDPQKIYDQLYKSKGVIIFGTGNCGAIVLQALKDANIKVVCLTDNNVNKWGKKTDDIEIVPPDQLKTDYKDCPVLIAVDLNFPYIRKQLKSMGVKDIYDSDFIFSKLEIDLKKCKNVSFEIEKQKSSFAKPVHAWNIRKITRSFNFQDLCLCLFIFSFLQMDISNSGFPRPTVFQC